MRLSELKENKHEETKAALPEMLAKIKQDCQPFLKAIDNEIHNYQLYRGIKNSSVSVIYDKPVRLDGRKPRDTYVGAHDSINHVMTELYGEPFRNSVFCAGNKLRTFSYGPPYFIFPKGNFTFCWSPFIIDMAETSFAMLTNVDRIKQRLEDAQYMTTDLKRAIKSKHEIMIRCDSYHAISCPMSDSEVNEIIRMMSKGLR